MRTRWVIFTMFLSSQACWADSEIHLSADSGTQVGTVSTATGARADVYVKPLEAGAFRFKVHSYLKFNHLVLPDGRSVHLQAGIGQGLREIFLFIDPENCAVIDFQELSEAGNISSSESIKICL